MKNVHCARCNLNSNGKVFWSGFHEIFPICLKLYEVLASTAFDNLQAVHINRYITAINK